jgi:hypothetical protein
MQRNVHICHTIFLIKMKQNSHETTSQWKTYGKQLFFEDIEVGDVLPIFGCSCCSFRTFLLKVGIGQTLKWMLLPQLQDNCRWNVCEVVALGWCRVTDFGSEGLACIM